MAGPPRASRPGRLFALCSFWRNQPCRPGRACDSAHIVPACPAHHVPQRCPAVQSYTGLTVDPLGAEESRAARPDCRFPIRRLVVSSGGGFVPDNDERRRLLSYDGTPEAMRAILRANFHDPAWAEDDAYIKRRVEASLAPGAWEAVAAARLKP